jgi:hypothetical protein
MEHATRSNGIGRRIKRLRESKGLTASRLAERAGITENALRKIESGDSKEPRFSTGVRIARALDIEPHVLIAHSGQDRHDSRGLALVSVLAHIRAKRAELERVGVEHLSVFGSVARGEADIDSDVDVVVDAFPEASLSLFDIATVASIVERALNRHVDVVTRGSLRSAHFASVAEKDAVRAF